ALPEIAFARRVRVRSFLGRCAASRGRTVLSQALVRRAVHAGDGPQAAGGGATCAGNPAGAGRGDRRDGGGSEDFVRAFQLSRGGYVAGAGGRWPAAARRPAIPLDQPRLQDV